MTFLACLKENKVILILSLVVLAVLNSLFYRLGMDLVNISLITISYLLVLLVASYLIYIKKKAYLDLVVNICEETNDSEALLEVLSKIRLTEKKLYRRIVENIDRGSLEINIDIRNNNYK